MKPDISETINGFIFEWKEEAISIHISRLKMHTADGRVTGELIINTTAPGYSSVLHPPTQMNFSADRTRKELLKTLKEKYPDWNWQAILDQLAFHIQDKARRGEPVRELWIAENQDIQPPEILLDPIILKGVPTIIFGEKGANKSTLALIFYICLVLPWHENPLGLKTPTRSVKTLILDWEQEWEIVQYYARRIQIGMDLPAFPIQYRRCGAPLASDVEQIQKHIADTKAEVVIIDSLGAASGGELNNPEPALNFFTALRKLKVSSLIIAQTSKDLQTKKKTIYGSTFFTYYARSIFELCKSEGIGDGHSSLALFHRWANYSALTPPLGFDIFYNGQSTSMSRQAIDIQEFKTKVKAQQLILNELKHGLLSVKEIAERSGIAEGTIQVILSKLKKRDQVINPEHGKWGILTHET